MGTISKNFSYSEFEKSETADRYGICNVIIDFKVRDAIKALVESVLQPLRDAYGKAMKINSGYRCQELNSHPVISGSKTSQHCKGEAADIHTGSPTESYRLAKLSKDIGLPYDQMILYPTFVHLSHKLEGQQRRAILYNSSYHGRRV